jgi:translation elongation factor EF-4
LRPFPKNAFKFDLCHRYAEYKKENLQPLPGFRLAKPMVFQGLFPTSADQFEVGLGTFTQHHDTLKRVSLSPNRYSSFGSHFATQC